MRISWEYNHDGIVILMEYAWGYHVIRIGILLFGVSSMAGWEIHAGFSLEKSSTLIEDFPDISSHDNRRDMENTKHIETARQTDGTPWGCGEIFRHVIVESTTKHTYSRWSMVNFAQVVAVE